MARILKGPHPSESKYDSAYDVDQGIAEVGIEVDMEVSSVQDATDHDMDKVNGPYTPSQEADMKGFPGATGNG